jgi:hypothetical protein
VVAQTCAWMAWNLAAKLTAPDGDNPVILEVVA